MSIKIYTLIENENCENNKNNLMNEFGLSFCIEDEKFLFIFDTGKTGEFINNAKKMNIDLTKIKNIVLSHSHFDHTGGLKNFIENISKNFTLHIHKSFFEEKYKLSGIIKTFLGNNFNKEYLIKNKIKINYITKDSFKISKNITLHTNFNSFNTFEKPQKRYIKKVYNDYILDKMEDEIVLSLNTSKGIVIIAACSHIGIVNIIENIKRRENKKIYGVIGGLHLKRADNEVINSVINYFIKNNLTYFRLCHCTGNTFIEKMKKFEYFKNVNVFSNNTGNTIIL